MRKIYLDSDLKCHVKDDGTMRAIETDEFDGKCDVFIEGHRFVPENEVYVRPDGKVFHGKMKTPWKNYDELGAAQKQYETDMAELEAAYQEGVNSAYG